MLLCALAAGRIVSQYIKSWKNSNEYNRRNQYVLKLQFCKCYQYLMQLYDPNSIFLPKWDCICFFISNSYDLKWSVYIVFVWECHFSPLKLPKRCEFGFILVYFRLYVNIRSNLDFWWNWDTKKIHNVVLMVVLCPKGSNGISMGGFMLVTLCYGALGYVQHHSNLVKIRSFWLYKCPYTPYLWTKGVECSCVH